MGYLLSHICREADPADNADPNTSSQAKRHAEEVLGSGISTEPSTGGSDDLHQTRVNAGYNATIHSQSFCCSAMLFEAHPHPCTDPNVSEEAQEHARDYLAQNE